MKRLTSFIGSAFVLALAVAFVWGSAATAVADGPLSTSGVVVSNLLVSIPANDNDSKDDDEGGADSGTDNDGVDTPYMDYDGVDTPPTDDDSIDTPTPTDDDGVDTPETDYDGVDTPTTDGDGIDTPTPTDDDGIDTPYTDYDGRDPLPTTTVSIRRLHQKTATIVTSAATRRRTPRRWRRWPSLSDAVDHQRDSAE